MSPPGLVVLGSRTKCIVKMSMSPFLSSLHLETRERLFVDPGAPVPPGGGGGGVPEPAHPAGGGGAGPGPGEAGHRAAEAGGGGEGRGRE